MHQRHIARHFRAVENDQRRLARRLDGDLIGSVWSCPVGPRLAVSKITPCARANDDVLRIPKHVANTGTSRFITTTSLRPPGYFSMRTKRRGGCLQRKRGLTPDWRRDENFGRNAEPTDHRVMHQPPILLCQKHSKVYRSASADEFGLPCVQAHETSDQGALQHRRAVREH
jgi:hypothetical protein